MCVRLVVCIYPIVCLCLNYYCLYMYASCLPVSSGVVFECTLVNLCLSVSLYSSASLPNNVYVTLVCLSLY